MPAPSLRPLALFCLLAVPGSMALADSSDPPLAIAAAVWTAAVDPGSKQPVGRLTRASPGKRLVLWMNLSGTAAALDQLAAQGRLPIRHKWFRESMLGIDAQGVAMPHEEIEIPAAAPGVIDKLRREVAASGHFSWRTWSLKDKVARGTWRVTVVYADNTPVLCPGDEGKQPCEYVIAVR